MEECMRNLFTLLDIHWGSMIPDSDKPWGKNQTKIRSISITEGRQHLLQVDLPISGTIQTASP